jgi:hypothetical protein
LNSKRKVVIAVVGVVAVLVLAVAAAFAVTQIANAGQNRLEQRVVGSWAGDAVNPDGPVSPNLWTILSDGTVIGDESLHAYEGTGYGVWAVTGRDEVSYVIHDLFGSESGALSARIKLLGTLHYDAGADTLSGPFKVTVTAADGSTLYSGGGTMTLKRIKLERLP